MANLSNIITPTNVLTETSTNTVTNKTINIANNTLTGVQASLVSGTSIKTINGGSVLGSGDIVTPAGAMILISSVDAASSATIDLTLPSGYSAFQVIFFGTVPSAETRLEILYTTNNFSTATTWDNNVLFVYTTSSSTSPSSTTDGQILLNQLTDGTYPGSGVIKLFNPTGSGQRKSYVGQVEGHLNTGARYTGICGGIAETTSALNGVRFRYSGANVSTGTFKLYGII